MTTINLFSANQSDAEYDISGFYTGGSSSTGQGPFAGGGVTISRDTTLSAHGAACLKAQTDGFGAYQALEVRVNVSGQFVASGTYTLSGYVYSVTGGGSLRIYCQSSSGDLSPVSTETLAAGWNRYSIEVTLPNPITQSWIGLRFDTGGTAQALTYWVDCLQFQSGNLSPWVPGGNNTLPYMAYIQGLPVDIIAGTMSIQDALGQRSTGSISVWTKPGIAWGYGTAIAIYDNNSNCAYSGFVSKDKKYKSGARLGTGILQHDLSLMDNMYKADKRVVFQSYLNSTAGYIVNDLLGRVLAAEGVTSTPTSIATGPVITEVIWNGKQVSAALTWLAQQAGYWVQIDKNNVLWFQPYTGVPGATIDGSTIDATSNLSVEGGNDMYVNTQYTRGAMAETAILTETLYGDGHKFGFTLSYEIASPSSKDLSIYDSSTSTTYKLNSGIGSKGNNGQRYYVAVGDAVVAMDASLTPLSTTQYIQVTYKGRYPVVAVAKNQALISTQQKLEQVGTGIIEKVYSDTKVHTLAAAFQIASALLAHYGVDTIVLDFDTRTTTYAAGQSVLVNLSDFALNNATMLLNNVNITDPDGYNIWYHIQAIGSPIEPAQWQTFWQNLMNQQADPADLSDTTDTSLALLLDSVVTRTPVVTVTRTKNTCPICGPTTICGPTLIVC